MPDSSKIWSAACPGDVAADRGVADFTGAGHKAYITSIGTIFWLYIQQQLEFEQLIL